MKKIILDIIKWLRKPDEKELDISFKQKINVFKFIFLLDVIIIFLAAAIRAFLKDNIIDLNYSSPSDPNAFITGLIGIVIIIPIIEELVFRFPLVYKRNYLIRFINWHTSGWLKEKWHKNYMFVLYGSILSFSFIHSFNYDNNGVTFIALLPLILFDHITHGILFSYSRVKLGFIWSSVLHMANNLFISVLVYLGNMYILNNV